MGTGSFPGVKIGRAVTLTTHPLLVPWSRKGRAVPLLPVGRTACTEPQCLYNGPISILPFTHFLDQWFLAVQYFRLYLVAQGLSSPIEMIVLNNGKVAGPSIAQLYLSIRCYVLD